MNKSASQVIDDKGGAHAVARAVGKPEGVVRQWKVRNRFPRSAWPEITAAFPDLTQDALKVVESHGPRR